MEITGTRRIINHEGRAGFVIDERELLKDLFKFCLNNLVGPV